MFETLTELTSRPTLFACHDTAALWADPHVADRMLQLHLDESSDLASRPRDQIRKIVEWLARRIPMDGKSLTDLGCGPGLYARHFQEAGAQVTGIDLSENSIAYAADQGSPDSRFIVGSYNDSEIPPSDIVTLIYGDVCAMPQSKRLALFRNVRSSLLAGGHFILDCFAPSFFLPQEEGVIFAENLDGGLWAPTPYFGFKQTFVYEEETTVLDRYLIVERERSRWVHNWMQYMSPEVLTSELDHAGFAVEAPVDILTGDAWQPEQSVFCLLARKS